MRVAKDVRTNLDGYFYAVIDPIYKNKRFHTTMRRLHSGYEIDGIEIQLPNSDEVNKNYYKMPLRSLMERGLERRIRFVKVQRNDRLWITLW